MASNGGLLGRRSGGRAGRREGSGSSVSIGDSVTGTWRRALALAPPENLAYAVEHLNDETH